MPRVSNAQQAQVPPAVGSRRRPALKPGAPIVTALTVAWTAAAVFVPVYRALPGSISNLWLYLVMGVIAVSLLAGFGGRPKWFGIWLLGGYAASTATLTSSGAAGIGSTLETGIQLFVAIGLAPFAIRGVVQRNPRVLVAAAAAFIIGQSISAAVGVAQLFGASVLGWVQVNERSPGLAGHPNVLGVMASIAVLLLVAAVLQRRASQLVLTALLAINVAGMITTGSLSSMAACAFGVIVLLYAHGFRLVRIILVGVAVTLILIWAIQLPVVSAYLRDPLQRFLQVTGQTDAYSTLDIRSQTYDAAWEGILREPFMGAGIGASTASVRSQGTVVHNLPLRAWYQGGILLGVAVAVIIVAMLIIVVRSLATKQDALAAGIIVTVMAFAMTAAFFEQVYYWLPVLAAWASLAPDESRRRPRRPAFAL